MDEERCKRGHLISEVGRTKSRRCKQCHREDNRAYQSKRYHTDPEYKARNHQRKKEWAQRNRARASATDKAWRQRNRARVVEAQRIWCEAKRREQGIPIRTDKDGNRVYYGRSKPPTNKREVLRLDAAPFRLWLQENGPQDKESRLRWCRSRNVDEGTIRRIMDGTYKKAHIDIVDRCVDPATLNRLYPVDA